MFNSKLKNKIKELEDLISKLTTENMTLKEENKRLRETKPAQQSKTPYTTAITSTTKNPIEQLKYTSTDNGISQRFDEVVAEIDNFSNRNYGNYNYAHNSTLDKKTNQTECTSNKNSYSSSSHDSYSSSSSCDSGSSSSSSCD